MVFKHLPVSFAHRGHSWLPSRQDVLGELVETGSGIFTTRCLLRAMERGGPFTHRYPGSTRPPTVPAGSGR